MTGNNDISRFPLRDQVFNPDGGAFVFAEWIAPVPPAGTREEIAPPHVHHHDDEAWYILEGTLGFRFDGHEFEIPAGGVAYARAGTVHTYWNAGTSPARYLLTMTPRIQALIAALHDPARAGQPFSQRFAEFDSELVSESN